MSLNLDKYKNQVLTEEDKLLFEEVEKCITAGAYRAAYIMTWIACAESLKKRFKEASKRDHHAGSVVGKINNMESQKKSIDSFLIDEAQKYGFISLAAHSKLDHILTFRSVYAHPYEEAPTEEELLNAISVVVAQVLSQPIKLKEGFVNNQLQEILNNPHFLDDTKDRVVEYANDILQRISEDCYPYMLDKLCKELEKIIIDPSLVILTRRGLWFSSVLVEPSYKFFKPQDWHDFVTRYPQVAPFVLTNKKVFKKIGNNAQDSIVGNLLGAAEKTPTSLQALENLFESGSLSNRQNERFLGYVDKFNQEFHNSMSAEKLRASGLKTKTCLNSIIAHLKKHNWYVQNPVALLVLNNGSKGIEEVDREEQNVLGRNILQAADGCAGDANRLIDNISEEDELWPTPFVFGMLVECFVNEQKMFRLKLRKLDEVCKILDKYHSNILDGLLNDLVKEMEEGKPKNKYSFDDEDIQRCKKILDAYSWGKPLAKEIGKIINKKKKALKLEATE